MLRAICPKCSKGGLRRRADYSDGVYYSPKRYCPRCEQWIMPQYLESQSNKIYTQGTQLPAEKEKT